MGSLIWNSFLSDDVIIDSSPEYGHLRNNVNIYGVHGETCVMSCFLHSPISISTKYVAFLHTAMFRQEKVSSFSLQLNVCFPTLKQGAQMLFS